MNRDKARQIIIAACFQDASGKTNYIENAIASIETAARVKGLRIARNALARNDIDNRIIEAIIDAEIAALERGTGGSE